MLAMTGIDRDALATVPTRVGLPNRPSLRVGVSIGAALVTFYALASRAIDAQTLARHLTGLFNGD